MHLITRSICGQTNERECSSHKRSFFPRAAAHDIGSIGDAKVNGRLYAGRSTSTSEKFFFFRALQNKYFFSCLEPKVTDIINDQNLARFLVVRIRVHIFLCSSHPDRRARDPFGLVAKVSVWASFLYLSGSPGPWMGRFTVASFSRVHTQFKTDPKTSESGKYIHVLVLGWFALRRMIKTGETGNSCAADLLLFDHENSLGVPYGWRENASYESSSDKDMQRNIGANTKWSTFSTNFFRHEAKSSNTSKENAFTLRDHATSLK